MQQGQLPVRSFQVASLKHLHADLHVIDGTTNIRSIVNFKRVPGKAARKLLAIALHALTPGTCGT